MWDLHGIRPGHSLFGCSHFYVDYGDVQCLKLVSKLLLNYLLHCGYCSGNTVKGLHHEEVAIAKQHDSQPGKQWKKVQSGKGQHLSATLWVHLPQTMMMDPSPIQFFKNLTTNFCK